MLSLFLTFLALSPLVVQSLPHNNHHPEDFNNGDDECEWEWEPIALPTPTESASPVTFSSIASVIPSFTASEVITSATPLLPTLVTVTKPFTEASTAVAEPTPVKASSVVSISKPIVASTPEPATPATSTASPIEASPSPVSSVATKPATAAVPALAGATQVSSKIASKVMCGDSDRLIMPGYAWTVANSMFGAADMVGTQCTNFDHILQAEDGTLEVKMTSVTNIDYVDATEGVCKGYSNVGVGPNLQTQLKDVKSIPAYYQWERTNTTEFKGNNCFDFITSPTKGDGSSTASSEFMLWIEWWGGQIPIGFADGPVASLSLFGQTFSLYEGKNTNNGVTVRSALVDGSFNGEFSGNLKDWLEAMVAKGYISDSDYVNVGNAGSEIFYGDSTQEAVFALNVNI